MREDTCFIYINYWMAFDNNIGMNIDNFWIIKMCVYSCILNIPVLTTIISSVVEWG